MDKKNSRMTKDSGAWTEIFYCCTTLFQLVCHGTYTSLSEHILILTIIYYSIRAKWCQDLKKCSSFRHFHYLTPSNKKAHHTRGDDSSSKKDSVSGWRIPNPVSQDSTYHSTFKENRNPNTSRKTNLHFPLIINRPFVFSTSGPSTPLPPSSNVNVSIFVLFISFW